MASGHQGTFVPKEGRRAEAIEMLMGSVAFAEEHGAIVSIRSSVIGGPETGRLTIAQVFENPDARASFLDAADAVEKHSIRDTMASADPPAGNGGRILFDEVGEGDMPLKPAIMFAVVFGIGPGKRQEANEVLAATSARHSTLGVQSRNWQIALAGSSGAQLARTSAFDTWADYTRFVAGNQAIAEPQPLGQGIASGALQLLSTSASRSLNR